MNLTKIRDLCILLALVILAFGIGLNIGSQKYNVKFLPSISQLTEDNSQKSENLDLSLFWEVWNRLNHYYIDKKALIPQKIVYGAISGMVNALGDPYTIFLPPDQNKEAKDDLGGKLEGIGVQLGIKDKKIVVIAPLKGTPAEKAGMKTGDWIMKVNGTDTSDWTLPYAVSKIRGPKGTSVTLTVLHKDASMSGDLKVTRDSIIVKSLEWNLEKVNCNNSKCQIVKNECTNCSEFINLKLSRFGDDTNSEWTKEIDNIKLLFDKDTSKNIKGIVFDLRNNPGGYLTGSIFVASEFIKNGIIVTQETTGGVKQNFNVNRNGKLIDIPLVVLVNKGTASAGEIVAGALKERIHAKLVGETTFGKGSVQEAQELVGGAGIHITTSKWLLPSGKWINGSGVDPDVKIINDQNKPDEDLQLEKAIEILLK